MLFRECRLNMIHQLLKYTNSDSDMLRAFLAIGGITAGLYVINEGGIKYIVPTGCRNISAISICQYYGIDIHPFKVSDFIKNYRDSQSFREDYFFVVPCSSDVLNTRSISKSTMMIGQSELLVSTISFDDNRIEFNFDIDIDKKYWMDLDVLQALVGQVTWPDHREYRILAIPKTDVAGNSALNALNKASIFDLCDKSLKNYFIDSEITYMDSISFITGPKTFQIAVSHYNRLLDYYLSEKDETKRLKIERYLKFQLKHYYMFLIAGSDGFYRNELAYALEAIGANEVNKELIMFARKFTSLSKEWRAFGRNLGRMINQDHSYVEAVHYICSQLENLSEIEVRLMQDLEGYFTLSRKTSVAALK